MSGNVPTQFWFLEVLDDAGTLDEVELPEPEPGNVLDPVGDPDDVVQPAQPGPLLGDPRVVGAEVEVDDLGGCVVQLLSQEQGVTAGTATRNKDAETGPGTDFSWWGSKQCSNIRLHLTE